MNEHETALVWKKSKTLQSWIHSRESISFHKKNWNTTPKQEEIFLTFE